MRKKTYLSVGLLVLTALSLLAQNQSNIAREENLFFNDTVRRTEKMTEIGLFFGAFRYCGDVSDDRKIQFRELTPAGGIFLRRHLIPNLALRANVLGGQLHADDTDYDMPYWRPDRASSFTTKVGELSLQAEWDILGKRRFRHRDTLVYTLDRYRQIATINKMRPTFAPYIYVGGGLIASNSTTNYNYPYAQQSNQSAEIQEDARHDKRWLTQAGLSFGGGLHLDLGRYWVLGAEIGARAPFSDYLDGISQSGNPGKSDWYWSGGLTLGVRLGARDRDGDGIPDKTDKCPDTPGSVHGCPDADHDGIADRDDECPHRRGILSLAGCPLKDADNDSVPDVDDLCPKVPGLVKFQGCPDTDGDGVEDKLDSCLTVPGVAQFNGCPDTDGDGVEDKVDFCVKVAGLPQFNGCPDTDGDGIEDKKDECPNEKGVAEFYNGCPVRDTDGDGVEDKLDACPKVAGKPELKGCPDTDGDGVADQNDLCPTIAGKIANRGCPEVEKVDQAKLDLAVKAVKFESGKAILKTESNKILDDIVAILLKYPAYYLRVEGHTDDAGKAEANQVLSEQRAKTCVDYLTQKGVLNKRFAQKGFGETKPITENKTVAGRAKNRRVEFILFLPEQ